jgi:MtrB/PioB family decaheme-associated outer membrane protein
MRTRLFVIGALLLVPAGFAQAQNQQQQVNPTSGQMAPAQGSVFQPTLGHVDFGFRAEDINGDKARYNKYRDFRQGAYLDRFSFEKETSTMFFRAEANNVGYRDQRYYAAFQDIGRLKASFEWNQVPLFLSADSRSLYTHQGGGVLAIGDAVQQTLQAAVAAGTAARDLAIAQAAGGAGGFDLRSRRDVGAFNLVYSINRDMDFKVDVKNTLRSGSQVFSFGFGTSPGLNPSVELPAPIDDRTTDVRGVLEFANQKGMFAVGYTGSWYDNSIPTVRFDNPLRAVDIAGGPSVGQASWWPTSTSVAFIANGNYKLAPRTRASAALSFGRWSQDEPIPPPTVNTALVSPNLPRATAQTEANIMSMVYNLNSRPVRNVWLNAKYRYYDYDNQTAHFEISNAVIGDWTAGTQHHENEPSSFKRRNLDLDASFTPHKYLSLGVGYGREDADRTWRIFESTADDTFRVSVDSVGNQYVTLRTKYEYSSRTGSGFDVHLLEEVGEQPGMRHFDIADRDRTRANASVYVTPVPYLSFNAGVGNGHDDYTDTGFGLRDSKNRHWSAGFDVAPNDMVSFGVSYTDEKYTANQYSRQTSLDPASPAGQAQFNDPVRDWWTDTDDRVKTLAASLDLIKALPKTDIRLGYDLSDGKATYLYGVPSNSTIFTTTPLQQLQPLKNKLQGAQADVRYYIRSNVALGVAYHYEDYQVDDFALGPERVDRMDVRNASGGFASTLYTGYLFRPYTAHTAWMRVTYLW